MGKYFELIAKCYKIGYLKNDIFEEIKIGLYAGHNSCYFNSLLQILLSISEMNTYIYNLTNDDINKFNTKKDNFKTFIKFYKEFINNYIDYKINTEYLTDFKINKISFLKQSLFGNKNQKDAHSALQFILEALQEGSHIKNIIPENDDSFTNELLIQDKLKKKENNNSSEIKKLFSIYSLNRNNPNSESNPKSFRFESIKTELELELMIKNNTTQFNSLYECLHNYFSNQEYGEGSKIKKKYLNKTPYLVKTSTYLFILMKKYNNYKKINANIKYPQELDLKKYFIDKSLYPGNYQLHAIIYHSGTTAGGHYTASVRKLVNNKYEWYYFNDNAIPVKKIPDYNDEKAYVLLYKLEKK